MAVLKGSKVRARVTTSQTNAHLLERLRTAVEEARAYPQNRRTPRRTADASQR